MKKHTAAVVATAGERTGFRIDDSLCRRQTGYGEMFWRSPERKK
ncbi:hypothetical protein [Klebsiella pneumoniae]